MIDHDETFSDHSLWMMKEKNDYSTYGLMFPSLVDRDVEKL